MSGNLERIDKNGFPKAKSKEFGITSRKNENIMKI